MCTIDRDALIELARELRAFEGTIIVEGKKDVRALAAAGVRSIELTDSADAVLERLNEAGVTRILVLTDRDAEGRKLAAQIRSACERLGIAREPTLRRRFFAETLLRQLEGFDTLLARSGIAADRDI